MARHAQRLLSWLRRPLRLRQQPPQPTLPTWATQSTDSHAWANAPTAYQPLVEWDGTPVARPYVDRPYAIRECDG